MTDIRFYHLTRSTLEQALPKMLELTLERDGQARVILGSEARRDAMNDHLWTYNDRVFLPHGTAREGYAADQPIWLDTSEGRDNPADHLFYTDGSLPSAESDLEGIEVCAVLFNGADPQELEAARACWKSLKDAGRKLTYWQQQERGWKKAAET